MANVLQSRLTYIKLVKEWPNPKAIYRCECGNEKELFVGNVKRNHTRSCGCLKKEILPSNTKHRLKKHLLYSVWGGIKRRCYIKTSQDYYLYGGRGVTMCDEWKNDFKSFYDWCISNGWKKGLKIDKDIKGGLIYSPENCLIVTNKENCNNTRSCRVIKYNGMDKNLKQWSDFFNISVHSFRYRLKKCNWEIQSYINKWSV